MSIKRVELERFVVTEKDKPRNYIHMIVETPIHVLPQIQLIGDILWLKV